MKDGSMFAGLHAYEDMDYMLEHPYIYIYEPDRALVYQVFAAVSYDDRLILEAYDDFTEEGSVETFAEEIRSHKNPSDIVDDSVLVGENEELIVLSTCEKTSDTRFLVVAKRIR
jgi:sortase B